jgi:hypothetical protein
MNQSIGESVLQRIRQIITASSSYTQRFASDGNIDANLLRSETIV